MSTPDTAEAARAVATAATMAHCRTCGRPRSHGKRRRGPLQTALPSLAMPLTLEGNAMMTVAVDATVERVRPAALPRATSKKALRQILRAGAPARLDECPSLLGRHSFPLLPLFLPPKPRSGQSCHCIRERRRVHDSHPGPILWSVGSPKGASAHALQGWESGTGEL